MTASDRFLRGGGGGIASIPKLQWALDGGGYAADLLNGIPVLRSRIYATAVLDPYPIAIQVPVLTLGASEFVDLGSNLGLVSGGAALPFSIVAKIKPTADSTTMVICASSRGIRFDRTPTNKLRAGIYVSTGNRIAVLSTEDIVTNQEYEVAATYDGSGLESGIKIYINGELSSLTSNSGGTLSAITSSNMTLGRWDGTFGAGHSGRVKIYPVELTAVQVASEITSDAIETVAHYVCQEGAGSTIYDISGNDNHGAITAATAWANKTNTTKDQCVVRGGLIDGGAFVPLLTDGSEYANGDSVGSAPSNEIRSRSVSPLALIDRDPFNHAALASLCASSPYAVGDDVKTEDGANTKFEFNDGTRRNRLITLATAATSDELGLLSTYYSTPLQMLPPDALSFTPSVNVYRSGSAYTTDFDETLPTRLTLIHVDPVNGVDANDGSTWLLAKKTLTSAITRANAVTTAEIICRPGGGYLSGTGTVAINRPVTIRSETPGQPVFITNGRSGPDFSVHSGATYVRSSHAPVAVFDCSVNNADGFPVSLTLRDTIQQVIDNPGSFAVVSGACYIQTADSRVLDRLVLTATTANTNRISVASGCDSLYLRDLTMLGHTRNALNLNSTTELEVKIVDCDFAYNQEAQQEIISITINGIIWCVRSRIYRSSSDAWNYNVKSTALEVVEIDCSSLYSGVGFASLNVNGTTTHAGCETTRVNGSYLGATHRGVHDIQNGCETWCINCVSQSGPDEGVTYPRAAFAIGGSVSDDAKMWLDDCRVVDSAGLPYYAAIDANNYIYYRNMVITGGANNVNPARITPFTS